MPLSIPSPKAVVASVAAYLRTDMPELDPSTARRSFVGGMVKALGLLLADFYVALKRFADREPWPQSASESFFTTGWWIDITKLPRRPAAAAQGRVVLTGTSGTIVPQGTGFSANSVSYTTDGD